MNLQEQAQKQPLPTTIGKNHAVLSAGKFSDLDRYSFKHPLIDKERRGKLFIKDYLDLTGMQISLNKLPAGRAVPFSHAHKENEEVYIFTGGKGQMQIDGEIFDVAEGTVVVVKPEGMRTWRNNSTEDLYYVVIQAKMNSLSQDTFDDGVPGDQPIVWPG
ncbi:MAG: cupin domain-containing protein [Candidatus Obscuribacterales bacterium]|nr:cupin domain-containing protein [Candidatus Obscuribacterales bacterium]